MKYGGPDGELGASLRYLSQRYSMPYPELDSLHEIVKRTGLLHYDVNNPNRQKELPVSRMLPKVRAGYTNVIFKLSKVLGAVVNEEDLGLDDYE